jgi:excisionase family DNA binding protein
MKKSIALPFVSARKSFAPNVPRVVEVPPMPFSDYITAADAAKELDVLPHRVRVLIHEGRLPAEKHGGVWFIRRADLDKVRDRPAGRPPRRKKS